MLALFPGLPTIRRGGGRGEGGGGRGEGGGGRGEGGGGRGIKNTWCGCG